MFIFKLFTLNNIFFYVTYFILFVFLIFIGYKFLYVEQSIYLLTNKINKLEFELQPVELHQSLNNNNNNIKTAEIIMNEIFNSDDNIYCSDNVCSVKQDKPIKNNDNNSIKITAVETKIEDNPNNIVNEIFELKKEDDKESIISNTNNGGHATKKALMKLSIDKLKAKCEERKLSIEGTKNQLADRIIVHDNTIEITDIDE